MEVQSLTDLRKNLEVLVRESGMSVEEYARSKKMPKRLLEELLACQEDDPRLASNLETLCNRLGYSVAQLLASNSSCQSNENRLSVPANPTSDGSDHLLARQLGRLIEDFVECDEAGRFEVTALAQELAEEQLRRNGQSPKVSGPRT